MVEEGLVPAKPKNEYMLLGEGWLRSKDGDYVGKEIRSSGKADVSRVGGGGQKKSRQAATVIATQLAREKSVEKMGESCVS